MLNPFQHDFPDNDLGDVQIIWNDAGTTFTAFKLNVTDTASAAGSLLMDLQVGGTSKFNVRKDGVTVIEGNVRGIAGSAAAPAFSFSADMDNGMFRAAIDTLGFATAGVERMRITSTGVDVTGTITSDGLTVDGGGSRQYINSGHLRLSDGYNLEWGGGTNAIQGSNASNYILLKTNNTERMRIDSSGNVHMAGTLHLDGNSVGGTEVTIADDAVASITPPRNGGGYILMTQNGEGNPNTSLSQFIFYDVGTSLNIVELNANLGANVDVSTSDVTGTTGTDGNVTVAVQSGVVKIENRIGSSQNFQVTFL